MTLREKIEVMQAYEDGKKIQNRVRCTCQKWMDTDCPTWNWYHVEYRIKPESKLRPYENAEEFTKAQKEDGLYVHHKKNKNSLMMPICADNTGVMLFNDAGKSLTLSYSVLLNDFVWQNETPCGVTEE